MEVETLQDRLRRLSRPGELCEKLPDGSLHCYACGHHCRIKEGRFGVCRVRFNEGGVLRAPWGYVGALQVDPIEKKPFFHALPGTQALSFGMLGCDYHCSFCLLPGEKVATEQGMLSIESLETTRTRVYSHTGRARRMTGFFQRDYSGMAAEIKAAGIPEIRCTPDHPILVYEPKTKAAAFRPAGTLRPGDLLAVPKRFEFSHEQTLDAQAVLEPLRKDYKLSRLLERRIFADVLKLASQGLTSREIGARIGKSASHVRHLKAKAGRVLEDPAYGTWQGSLVVEQGRVRFAKEHAPGIPATLRWNPGLARLMGYYCAEGSVSAATNRLASATLCFSFGPHEAPLADEVAALLRQCFGVEPWRFSGTTYERVGVSKSSLAALFAALCGKGAAKKRVPTALFSARQGVVEAFLEAYARGDGWVNGKGQTCVTTVSEELAWGAAWLLTKLGRRPMFYAYPQPRQRLIQGRQVLQSPKLYMIRWPWRGKSGDKAFEDKDFFYLPVRKALRRSYSGPVYNLEVEADHTFLAGFLVTHNCQNWFTSQALRDPAALAPPEECAPADLVELALRHKAPVIASTYNEPLITSEWAVGVFREARAAGLKCAYISNGNATPEVLKYLRPWVDFYKVDLKGFDDARYRRIMGGVLKTVLDAIGSLVAMGFWVEIVTLVIPTVNDSDSELRGIARFLASVSKDLPWHVTAFHKDYKMTDPESTPPETLMRAAEIGKTEGLRHIYAGNLPGEVGDWENTRCPACGELLVERHGFEVLRNRLRLEGSRGFCPKCGQAIPGVWAS